MSQEMQLDTGGAQDLSRFQWDALFLIAGMDQPNGLEVKAALEDYYGGSTEINHGRLYPNLDTLVEKGLVNKGMRNRRTNEYSLTGRGLRELQARHRWQGKQLEGHEQTAQG